jgi:hypothetical protein
MGTTIAIVGLKDGGRGKMTPEYFLPPFQDALAACGAIISHYSFREFIISDQCPDVAIFVYSEGAVARNLGWEAIDVAAKAAASRQILVIHNPSLGRIVAHKIRTNHVLADAGIAVPRIVSGGTAATRVFSNETLGAHAPVKVVDAGRSLDLSRYNTELIDTVHEHGGRQYYVALRAMAVGPHCVSIFLRMRPVEQGNPSVHNTDTPLDADLWNSLYRSIVVPQIPQIGSICQQVFGALGFGFYAHDILPERGTGRLLVCETGFKFDDRQYRSHLMPLRSRLMVDDFLSDQFAKRSGECFAQELPKLV